MGNYSSALIPETEEFVSVAEFKSELQSLVTLMMEEEQNNVQSEGMTLSLLQESPQETSQNETVLPLSAAAANHAPVQSFSSLLPKALSAVLHPTIPPGLSSNHRNPEKSTSTLQMLQTELRDLKEQFEQMKSQHNKEIKLLMNELDEEKRIRLTLQMEIQRMKKHMSK